LALAELNFKILVEADKLLVVLLGEVVGAEECVVPVQEEDVFGGSLGLPAYWCCMEWFLLVVGGHGIDERDYDVNNRCLSLFE
jgi:hypothetical protein